MKIKLRQDSRDQHIADHFDVGSITIPDTIEFERHLTNPVEAPSETDCTAISATDVATDQTGTTYSISDLWALTPKSNGGADPRDSMAVVVKHGLQPMNGGPRDTRWVSYMRSDGDNGDYFVTTQQSMLATQSSTTVASYWYEEFNQTPPGGVMPKPVNKVSGHDYKVTGWRQGLTEPEFHVKHWLGYMVWMPKSVYNTLMNAYGTGAYIPTTKSITLAQKSYFQSILDSIINALLAIQRQVINLQNNAQPMTTNTSQNSAQPVPSAQFPSKIVQWAMLIGKLEGSNPALNNPGDFKLSTLIASWGGTQGPVGEDGGHFAQFLTYQQGFTALCNFLKLGCEDELKYYHQARTIKEFTLVYTNHPKPVYDYSDELIKELGVTADTQISTFLT